MSKEFGKLTEDQFRELIQALPHLLALVRDVNEHLARMPAAKFDAVMSGDYHAYACVYELPLLEHLLLLVLALNGQDELKQWAESPDPQEAALEVLRRRDEPDDGKPINEAFDTAEVFALAYSVCRTLLSIATYGRSISSLLQDVRDNGNLDSLFKAIRMDRCVVGCPAAMKHMARAQLRDNKDFFKRLKSALNGPSKKEWAGLEQTRYALLVLRDLGIDDLSDSALEKLLVEQLKAYTPGQDPKKALRAHYGRSRKLQTI